MTFAQNPDEPEDDFQRWYHGGSPPESDTWPRHAFEEALTGRPVDRPSPASSVTEPRESLDTREAVGVIESISRVPRELAAA